MQSSSGLMILLCRSDEIAYRSAVESAPPETASKTLSLEQKSLFFFIKSVSFFSNFDDIYQPDDIISIKKRA